MSVNVNDPLAAAVAEPILSQLTRFVEDSTECTSFGTPWQSSFTFPLTNRAMATIRIAGEVKGIIAPPPAKAYVPPPR